MPVNMQRRTNAAADAVLALSYAAAACECRPGSVAVLRLGLGPTTPADRRNAEDAAGISRRDDGAPVCVDCGGVVVCVVVERRQVLAFADAE